MERPQSSSARTIAVDSQRGDGRVDCRMNMPKNNSQFPDILVCDGRTGVCTVEAVAGGAGLSELTEECGKADLQFGCPEYQSTVLIVVFPVSAGWSPG